MAFFSKVIMEFPYEPLCPSTNWLVGQLVLNVIIIKSGKLHFQCSCCRACLFKGELVTLECQIQSRLKPDVQWLKVKCRGPWTFMMYCNVSLKVEL